MNKIRLKCIWIFNFLPTSINNNHGLWFLLLKLESIEIQTKDTGNDRNYCNEYSKYDPGKRDKKKIPINDDMQ